MRWIRVPPASHRMAHDLCSRRTWKFLKNWTSVSRHPPYATCAPAWAPRLPAYWRRQIARRCRPRRSVPAPEPACSRDFSATLNTALTPLDRTYPDFLRSLLWSNCTFTLARRLSAPSGRSKSSQQTPRQFGLQLVAFRRLPPPWLPMVSIGVGVKNRDVGSLRGRPRHRLQGGRSRRNWSSGKPSLVVSCRSATEALAPRSRSRNTDAVRQHQVYAGTFYPAQGIDRASPARLPALAGSSPSHRIQFVPRTLLSKSSNPIRPLCTVRLRRRFPCRAASS